MTRFRRVAVLSAVLLSVQLLSGGSAWAVTQFAFSTGNPNGLMAMASRPSSSGKIEIEAADDFPLTDLTNLTGATFTGLLPSGALLSSVTRVVVEIYRVFPGDSNVGLTSGPPTFSTSKVPTRVNSPSDNALADADSASGDLDFTPAVLNPSSSASNSVLNGINPKPNQTTNGEGPVSGEEVSFNVSFTPPLTLPAGHYFFVPQVGLSSSGDFLWLSGPRPIVSPGTPFSPDLQTWIRNANLEPDWLRVGTDILGGSGTFNGTFALAGVSGCPTISVSPASVAAASAGQPYSASFSASGGSAPYTLTESGGLPSGMKFAGGTLSGTPTQAGSFPFTVTATDAQGCTGSTQATLTVAPAPGGSTVPAISSARLSNRTFRAAARGASLARRHKAPVGTEVSYRDSAAATTTFTVLRAAKGHRSGRKCSAGRPHRRQKRCTRYVKVGSFTHVDQPGAVSVRFTGRLHNRKLKPGKCRLALTPKASGASGKTVTLAFRIVR